MIAKQATYQGDYQIAGVDDHYFMSTALQPGPSTISFKDLTIPAPAGSSTPPRELMAFTLEPTRLEPPIRFYIGPKAFDVLYAIDPNLTNAIDFGFFRIIVAPLLRTLNSINGVIGNYGWSIVLLTVIINLILFPLRHKQVVSMRKMQAIQPEVKIIQDRYAKLKATDPAKQKMNQELMQLYQERGCEPCRGVHSDAAPVPRAPGLLRAADYGHRAAWCAVRRMDSRFVEAGSATTSRRSSWSSARSCSSG